ncbi:conserved membrane hypothetical protein [Hyella patelloides LEGE 07179]|uniref:Uncharacterized protein n=1 Tax=Hyella patelloides LEGE 07179 TaxID=945734 RepID=A0A563VIV2_9CYAN|nr:lysylphosphatidylglycerol synthase domain-containing protein [Hyella patelloides]VEP11368.1 conserved membrane hypothetical protein [Hyella patelloides LEGE 07179]
MKLQALLKRCIPIISILFFAVFLWILKQELGQYSFSDINASLSAVTKRKLNLAILLTIIGYFVISHYDKIVFLADEYPLKNRKILTTTFISYAVCNNLGFTLLIGGSIRYYFYNYYRVPKKTIAKTIAFSNLNFWLGLFAVGGITFMIHPVAIPQFLQIRFLTVRPLGSIFLILISIYLYCSYQKIALTFKGKTLVIPRLSISLAQIMVSALDWAIASAVLYVLLPTSSNLSYGAFFGIYLLAITAKVISNVPGGLGIFETVIIYFLPQPIIPTDALGSLLAYRGIYFLLPLFTSLILLGLYEIKKIINDK